MAGRYAGVIKRGRGFQISFQYQGQRCRETLLLPHTAKGEKEASDYLSGVRREITLGIFDYEQWFPNSRKAKTGSNRLGTIEMELNDFMRLHGQQLAKSTRMDYQNRINRHLVPCFGHIGLGELTRSEILEWVHSTTISPKSIRNILCPLKSTYREAIADGRLVTSPLNNLRLPDLNTREPKPFDENEIKAILSELSDQIKHYFAFAFETGLRTSELIELQWDDIDRQEQRVEVRRAKVRNEIKETKSRAGRRLVDLSDAALRVLDKQRVYSGHQAYVFLNPNTGDGWRTGGSLREHHWYPALKRAGVKPREPYQTRHTFASQKLSREKMSPIELAAQMGHADCSQIFRTYGRWIPRA